MISIESGVKSRLAAVGGSLALLSYLCGISKGALSESCAGSRNLGASLSRRVDEVLHDLEALAQSYLPARLDLRDARATEELLEAFKNKRARAKKDVEAATQRGAWELLRELVQDKPEVICARHSWTTKELLERMDAAHKQLQTETEALTAARLAFAGPASAEFNTFGSSTM